MLTDFFRDVSKDLKSISWRMASVLAFAVLAIYGMMLVEPTTVYDFSSQKGSAGKVFLTYFFMHRIVRGLISAFFHDFSPFCNAIIGLMSLFAAACLVWVLYRRLRFSSCLATLGAIVFLSTPFFFNFSIYSHVMPAGSMAFVFDALAFLAFVELRRCGHRPLGLLSIAVASAMCGTCVYQAHATFLLTGMFGICALSPKYRWKDVFADIFLIGLIMGAAVFLWALFSFGPYMVAMAVGYKIPPSGGCHDTVYWFAGEHTFWVNLKSLVAGYLVNWGYNAFFIVGLRYVLGMMLASIVLVLVRLCKRQYVGSVYAAMFFLSVFVFPTFQCSVANLRTHYCLIAFLCFGALLLVRVCEGRVALKKVVICLVLYGVFEMSHETATLYYYNWKLKSHDEMHMSFIAHDLWTLYGKNIQKPVAVVGGWNYSPTCWEDMRPFRELPLVNHPFTTYSNVNDHNVVREFYMVAREKVGLVVQMPESAVYDVYRGDKRMQRERSAYPFPGYIFETNGVVVVNLGADRNPWPSFKFDDFASPNERLLDRAVMAQAFDRWLMKVTDPFRLLAKAYPWAVEF